MTRVMPLVFVALACTLVSVPVAAEDPPKKLTAEERKKLEAKWKELTDDALRAYRAGKDLEATRGLEDALKVARQLYTEAEFPGGHPDVAWTLSTLGDVYQEQRQFARAEPLYKEALAVNKRLHKGDHPAVAKSLNSLGFLYWVQGKYPDTEPHFKEALEMRQRLHKGDHPDVALSLNNLATVYKNRGKYAASEPLFKDALEMVKQLHKGDHSAVAAGLNNLAALYELQGRHADAEPLFKDALEMNRRLHKNDHPDLARALDNLGFLYHVQGRYTEAEPLLKDALAMAQRLFRGDHPDIVACMNNLGALYSARGRHAEAEPLLKSALEMKKRLFKGDHPDTAQSLNNLAALYKAQGRYADAEPLYKDAVEMARRLFKGDHPYVAHCLHNLAGLYLDQAKYTDAEPLLKSALEMNKRLYKGDHSAIARGMNNLGNVYRALDMYAEAEPLYRSALEMMRQLFKEDYQEIAACLHCLGSLYTAQGKYAEAEPLYRGALEMNRRLTTRFAREKAEGEALTLFAEFALPSDAFLSNELARNAPPAAVYSEVWAAKGFVARAYERRQQQARAVTAGTRPAELLAELADARRRRAELLLAPATDDPATLAKRGADVKGYEERIDKGTRELVPLLPAIGRADRLAEANPGALQKVLPADAVVVDYLRFAHFKRDKDTPDKRGGKWTDRYLAFVVTRDKVAWVELDTAANIEPAVSAWREAITSGKEIPPAIPAKVRELVWEKVRKELPANIRTLYFCPDQALCRVPFAALPGDKPGTVLLEDFALATIPHAPFLLDKLWEQDPLKNPPTSALVVGGVKYDAELAAPGAPGVTRGDPLVKPGQKLGWSFLGNTAGEAAGFAAAATNKQLSVTRLDGERATTSAILSALPRAKYAHFATHGFFADPSFRSVFQLDEKDYEMRGTERVGKAANSPLVMTGLVFAGANNPKTPGRGILTGEQLIDLDLSGLELAVLSACETGLGDVAGGEGTFGLQRAFHYAGTTNVVASLWKVPDAPTAALMALFYTNLWGKNLSAMEALRQAQLELYRNPGKITELAKGFRGKFEEVPGTGGEVEIKNAKDGRAHPLLWAAFTLSGPGR